MFVICFKWSGYNAPGDKRRRTVLCNLPATFADGMKRRGVGEVFTSAPCCNDNDDDPYPIPHGYTRSTQDTPRVMYKVILNKEFVCYEGHRTFALICGRCIEEKETPAVLRTCSCCGNRMLGPAIYINGDALCSWCTGGLYGMLETELDNSGLSYEARDASPESAIMEALEYRPEKRARGGCVHGDGDSVMVRLDDDRLAHIGDAFSRFRTGLIAERRAREERRATAYAAEIDRIGKLGLDATDADVLTNHFVEKTRAAAVNVDEDFDSDDEERKWPTELCYN